MSPARSRCSRRSLTPGSTASVPCVSSMPMVLPIPACCRLWMARSPRKCYPRRRWGTWTRSRLIARREKRFGFVVREAHPVQMFKERNPFYWCRRAITGTAICRSSSSRSTTTPNYCCPRTYCHKARSYPVCVRCCLKKYAKTLEAAAFLANVTLRRRRMKSSPDCRRTSRSRLKTFYGCPAVQAPYNGRCPVEMRWDFDYSTARSPKLDREDGLLHCAGGVRNGLLAHLQSRRYPHLAMVNGGGFIETIGSINRSLECNGGNPAQVHSRINPYPLWSCNCCACRRSGGFCAGDESCCSARQASFSAHAGTAQYLHTAEREFHRT
uniref:Chitinase n=1 Tax=Streptomyces sp. DA1 TaxID=551767 RepID=B5AU42_9ACTN|nr:chitinase [Streptomyces sp. DA1]